MEKINIKPTPGYVLIEPVQKEIKTATGIYLPENTGEKPQRGKVLAVGEPEITSNGTIPSPVKPGEIVIYKKWGGNEVKIDNKDYLFSKFEDILAVEG
jgi:chaperonin GroES